MVTHDALAAEAAGRLLHLDKGRLSESGTGLTEETSMIANLWNLLGLAFKQLTRHRIRSLLTVAGVSIGMFLYAAVETMQRSLSSMTESSDEDNTLVVYQEIDLPWNFAIAERYVEEIRRIEGVVEALPVKIKVNNCGASLDVISFRGVPTDSLQSYNPNLV